MNPYNCRITRVIPKDHILHKWAPYYVPRKNYWIQEGRLNLPLGCSLVFARKSLTDRGPWGKWVFIPNVSTRWDRNIPGDWTEPYVLSSIMHFKKT